MRILGIGGVPASGKTTIARMILEHLMARAPQEEFRYGKLRGSRFGKVIVLGVYSENIFSGTDRLSMACQPDFYKFVSDVLFLDSTVFFEGDRLFNRKAIDYCAPRATCEWWILAVFEEVRAERAKQRGDAQSEKFVRSRHTKMRNLYFPQEAGVRLRINNNESNRDEIVRDAINFLEER